MQIIYTNHAQKIILLMKNKIVFWRLDIINQISHIHCSNNYFIPALIYESKLIWIKIISYNFLYNMYVDDALPSLTIELTQNSW